MYASSQRRLNYLLSPVGRRVVLFVPFGRFPRPQLSTLPFLLANLYSSLNLEELSLHENPLEGSQQRVRRRDILFSSFPPTVLAQRPSFPLSLTETPPTLSLTFPSPRTLFFPTQPKGVARETKEPIRSSSPLPQAKPENYVGRTCSSSTVVYRCPSLISHSMASLLGTEPKRKKGVGQFRARKLEREREAQKEELVRAYKIATPLNPETF